MIGMLSPHPRKLKEVLAMQRIPASLADCLAKVESSAIRKSSENWVVMWWDEGHAVSVDGGMTTAYRGIDTQGRLMWLVRHREKRHGYHSLAEGAHAALEEAEAAWEARRAVRAEWYIVEKVASDLLTGRRRFDVTLEDAHNSPLCSIGIESFLKRLRMPGRTRMSGRMAALLMKIEPQMGYVIHQAYLRTEGRRGIVAPLY